VIGDDMRPPRRFNLVKLSVRAAWPQHRRHSLHPYRPADL